MSEYYDVCVTTLSDASEIRIRHSIDFDYDQIELHGTIIDVYIGNHPRLLDTERKKSGLSHVLRLIHRGSPRTDVYARLYGFMLDKVVAGKEVAMPVYIQLVVQNTLEARKTLRAFGNRLVRCGRVNAGSRVDVLP